MPKTKYWKKGLARRKHVTGLSVDQLRELRQTDNNISKKKPASHRLVGRPRAHLQPYQTRKHGMSMFLFEDLEKTAKRLQYISSQNDRHSEGDNQTEHSTNTIADLKHEKQIMKEEIALLKLKIDVLLNMCAQATAVNNIQHDELKRLRAQIGET